MFSENSLIGDSLWETKPLMIINTWILYLEDVLMLMPFTHFIKLSLTVDFILVDKCQHDPVTDDGALED